MSNMRAKMVLESVSDQGEYQEILHFRAVYKDEYDDTGLDENNTYATYTPSAHIEMTVSNPALLGKLKEGEVFYVDFTKVE